MYKLGYLFVCAMILTGLSCSESGAVGENQNGNHINDPEDKTAPLLTINTPAADQIFNSGNTMSIAGNITDDLGLYRGSIRITNDANGELLKQQAYEIHGVVSYNFSINYTPIVSVASNYTITISFEDHGQNSTTKTVKVKVNL